MNRRALFARGLARALENAADAVTERVAPAVDYLRRTGALSEEPRGSDAEGTHPPARDDQPDAPA